jgi:hypothetical protein
MGGNVASADMLAMPRELVDFARANGCGQVDDFFDRPGMINPPYVYGWLPGDKEKSAVFWCKKTKNDAIPYKLMFKPADSKKLAGCAAVIEWRNTPGGLSIEVRRHLALRDFRYVSALNQTGPLFVADNAKVLVNYYDGLKDVFYCHEGQWLVASTE